MSNLTTNEAVYQNIEIPVMWGIKGKHSPARSNVKEGNHNIGPGGAEVVETTSTNSGRKIQWNVYQNVQMKMVNKQDLAVR